MFVYLPEKKMWLNLDHIQFVVRYERGGRDDGPLLHVRLGYGDLEAFDEFKVTMSEDVAALEAALNQKS